MEHILGFATERPGAAVITLEENRRSRPGIVAAANAFAASIPSRLPKSMKPVRTASAQETVAWSAFTEEDEAGIIGETILRLHAVGHRFRDVAVLFRSVRTSAPVLVDAFKSMSIPYSCGGRTGLFLQPEVSLIAEAYAWLVDGDWTDERFGSKRPADLDRVVEGLARCFGGGAEIPGLGKYLEDWKAFHRRGARTVSLVGDLYQLLAVLGADRIDPDTPQGAARLGALARLSVLLADYEHVNRRGRITERAGSATFEPGRDRGITYLRGLANYLLHYARDAYEDFDGDTGVDVDAVDILTVHQAKGLEWSIVFMPALVKGRFPSGWAGVLQNWLLPDSVFPDATRRRYQGSDAEERRLFFVAMTRARDCLYLSHFRKRLQSFEPSPYLVEVAGSHSCEAGAL